MVCGFILELGLCTNEKAIGDFKLGTSIRGLFTEPNRKGVFKKGKTTEYIVFFLALWVENVCIQVEYGGAYRMCVFRAENGHGKPESSKQTEPAQNKHTHKTKIFVHIEKMEQ